MEGSESEYCPLYTEHSQLAALRRAAFTETLQHFYAKFTTYADCRSYILINRAKGGYTEEVFGFVVMGESNDKQGALAFPGQNRNFVLTLCQQSDGASARRLPADFPER